MTAPDTIDTARTVPPADLADQAAEAIRALNHATLGWARPGYEYPADVDATIAHLHTLAMRLPQALGQALRWLEHEGDAGRIGHDQLDQPGDGPAINGQLSDLLGDLERAARTATELAADLDSARDVSAHLKLRDDTPGGAL